MKRDFHNLKSQGNGPPPFSRSADVDFASSIERSDDDATEDFDDHWGLGGTRRGCACFHRSVGPWRRLWAWWRFRFWPCWWLQPRCRLRISRRLPPLLLLPAPLL